MCRGPSHAWGSEIRHSCCGAKQGLLGSRQTTHDGRLTHWTWKPAAEPHEEHVLSRFQGGCPRAFRRHTEAKIHSDPVLLADIWTLYGRVSLVAALSATHMGSVPELIADVASIPGVVVQGIAIPQSEGHACQNVYLNLLC